MTKTQKEMIKELEYGPLTAVTLATRLGSLPGPMGRCMSSLSQQGLVKLKAQKTGELLASLTGDGKKVLKSLKK